MEFLPDGRFLLSERDGTTQDPGKLWLVTSTGQKIELSGLPINSGVLDVRLGPQFSQTHEIYVSFLEPGGASEPRVGRNAADLSRVPEGLAVFRATLVEGPGSATLNGVSVIWRQRPKIVSHPGSGEPGGYMTFSPNGSYLFIAAGDRQEFAPVQDLENTLGKIVRIFPNGNVPSDNPFVATSGALPEIWALGHRNPYGLAFDALGQLWEHEMGPEGGDEFNSIQAGGNYGWPLASNGRNYGSSVDDIPDHQPADGFVAPSYSWDPVIAPSGLIFYTGTLFEAWRGDAIIGGLRGRRLVRIHTQGTTASIVQEISMAERIRTIRQAPDGTIWIIEDKPSARVFKLAPVFAS